MITRENFLKSARAGACGDLVPSYIIHPTAPLLDTGVFAFETMPTSTQVLMNTLATYTLHHRVNLVTHF